MTTRFELVDEGFADPCLTTWPRHHIWSEYFHSIWSGRRGSNSLPPPWQGGALPDELRPHIGAFTLAPQGKTTRIGLEPTTPSVTGWCSNQLSYRAMIAQVRGCSPPERALLYLKNDFLSSGKLQKLQKTFRTRQKGQNKTSGTAAPNVCGRGSKFRTHGTRFWRPLLYQLSYTPNSMLHSLNA